MTDTNRHDKPADRRTSHHPHRTLKPQGQLILFSLHWPPDDQANRHAYFLRKPRP